jgi:hypothetical protein
LVLSKVIINMPVVQTTVAGTTWTSIRFKPLHLYLFCDLGAYAYETFVKVIFVEKLK